MRPERIPRVIYKYTLFFNFVNSCPQVDQLYTKWKQSILTSTHMRKKVRFIGSRKYTQLIPVVLAAFVASYLFLSPSLHQAAGNLFFGKVTPLYNVTLAKFFFERSAYPFLGNPEPSAHYQLSRTYFIQGYLIDAALEAEKQLEFYPNHIRTYYVLGLIYGYLNDEERAINMFSRYIENDTTSWAARNDKAWLQFRIGDIDGALETIEPVAHDIKNPWVQNTYGALLMNKKRYKEAERAFLYAKNAANAMTEKDWGVAYPGNDPRVYGTGLSAMRTSIEDNLALVRQKSEN